MNRRKPAPLILSCWVFLLVFLITFSLDLAFVLSFTTFSLLSHGNSIHLFAAAIVFFFIGEIFSSLDISVRFLSDFTFSGYILFVGGVSLYLSRHTSFLLGLRAFLKQERMLFSGRSISSFFLSLLFSLLLFPLVGKYVAPLIGYIIFSSLVKIFSGKLAVFFSLFFFFSAGVLLLFQKSALAEEFGTYTFFFLVVGSVQEVLSLTKGTHHIEKFFDRIQYVPESFLENPKPIIRRGNFFPKAGQTSRVSVVLPRLSPVLGFGVLSFLASFLLVFFSQQRLSLFPGSLPLDILRISVTPSPHEAVETPTSAPTPTPSLIVRAVHEMSDEIAKLAVFIQNGTEIQGLASSTSAVLKQSGFSTLEIGNADRSDYSHWEFVSRDSTTDFSPLLKRLLDLSSLGVSEATIPAGFDILIIGGKER